MRKMKTVIRDATVLAGLLGTTVVIAADPWYKGLPVAIFVSPTVVPETQNCYDTLDGAKGDPAIWARLQANLDLSIVVPSNPNPDGKLIDQFYLVNGVSDGDVANTTRIQIPPESAEQLCWTMYQGTNVGLATCDVNSADQTFQVTLPATAGTVGGLYLVNPDKTDFTLLGELPGKIEQPLTFTGTEDRRVCYYSAATGALLSIPTDEPAWYPDAEAEFEGAGTALAEVPKEAADITVLAGCVNADGSNNYQSFDCVVATAFNGAPAECATDLAATDCILNYLGAFCGDLVESRAAADDPIATTDVDTELENCALRTQLGPCDANPTGLACASGLFGGTPTDPVKRQEAAELPTELFPKDADIQASTRFVNFILGVVKSQFNTIANVVKSLSSADAETSAILCRGIAGAANMPVLVAKCDKIWKPHQMEAPEEAYSKAMEENGALVQKIVSNLLASDNALGWAKAMAPGTFTEIAGLFKTEENLAEGGVSFKATPSSEFTASGDAAVSGEVEMVELIGSASAAAKFANKAVATGALEGAAQTGFRNCKAITSSGMKKKKRQTAGAKLALACPAVPWADSAKTVAEQMAANPDAATTAPVPTILTPAGNLADVDIATLNELHDTYSAFASAGTAMPASWSDELKPWADRLPPDVTGVDRANVASDFIAQYGLTPEEVEAIRAWSQAYELSDPALFRAAMDKIPNYEGTVTRVTQMSQNAVDMLVKGEAGIISGSVPGTYDVRDLVVNIQSTNWKAVPPAPYRLIMATAPGVDKYADDSKMLASSAYTYVIKAHYGKYITPVSQGQAEIDFVDVNQGQFKLLGYGGPNAENPSVFYFENVADTPPVAP